MNETIQSPDERKPASQESSSALQNRERSKCPECRGQIRHDEGRGERSCADCGLVLDENEIDLGPEWRDFDEDDEKRGRVGAPATNLMHDKGLSTTIGWQDKDVNGQRIDPRKRPRIQRLRTWDERFRTKDSKERNLKHALGEIERMASALGLPKSCRETASVIYKQAVNHGLLPGRSIEAMATASLYAAARQHGMPRTLVAFETVSRVEKLPIQRAYRYMSKELGLAVEPADPVEYLPQIASPLSISDEAERMARDLLDTAKKQDLHSGRAPAGLAAAAVYAATQLTNEAITQETVGEAANVSTVTIRNRYQELLEAYGTRGDR